MGYTRVTDEVWGDLPGGLPAIWETAASGEVTLYLRGDLPPELADHFRAMCGMADPNAA